MSGPYGRRKWQIAIRNWRPTPLNALLGHHMQAFKKKKSDRDMVAAHAGPPKATGKRRVSLDITYTGRQQARDPDAMWKSLLDALVQCGQLIDDNPANVELGNVVQTKGSATQTVIILEDI